MLSDIIFISLLIDKYVQFYSEGSRRWIGKVLKPLVDVNESDIMTLDLPIDWFHKNSSNEDIVHGDTSGATPNNDYTSLCTDLLRIVDQEKEATILQQIQEDLNKVLKTIEGKLLAKKAAEEISAASTSSASITRVKMTSSSTSSKAGTRAITNSKFLVHYMYTNMYIHTYIHTYT